MKLKPLQTLPELTNFTGPNNPQQLKPHMGESYLNVPELVPIIHELNNWNLATAVQMLNDTWQDNPAIHEQILRLTGEVSLTYSYYEIGWALFDQILEKNPQDLQALFITTLCAYALDEYQEGEERMRILEQLFPDYAKKLEQVIKDVTQYKRDSKLERILNNAKSIDALAVYGQGLSDEGIMPSTLIERLKKTIELAMKYPDTQIMVSGGAVSSIHNEAEAMKNYLLNQGIAGNRIILEPYAKDTVGNSQLMTEIIQEVKFNSVCVITSLTHLPRAWLSMKASLFATGIDIPVYAAAYEAPGSLGIPMSEQLLSYITTIRAGYLFEKRDFIEQVG